MSYDDYRQVIEDAATKATATPIPRPDDNEHQIRWLIERAHREGRWKSGDDAIGFMAAAQAILRSAWLASVRREAAAEAWDAGARWAFEEITGEPEKRFELTAGDNPYREGKN